ncbi:MAG: glycosyltransferase family 4 protein, partial [Bacteroidota bacterium]
GSCGLDEASLKYLEELRDAAKGHPIYFHVNSSYEELRRCYNQATIFWHAAGYGVDEEVHPERAEHFGMSTVEAMSAGCIPIVVNAGGQKEIVSHGKSGYLWSTLEDLVGRTIETMADPERIRTMSQQAREQFHNFDHQHFADRLISLFHQLETD